MGNKLTAARSQHAELLTRRAKFDLKKRDCESLIANISAKLSGLEKEHSILEKRYLADEVSLAQVSASRQECDLNRAEMAEAKRLADLATEAIFEIDQQIERSMQSIAAIQREFCTEQRNFILREIQSDPKLKSKIITAMVAHATSGVGEYTFNAQLFAKNFLSSMIPAVEETEVREAAEKFQKDNDLN